MIPHRLAALATALLACTGAQQRPDDSPAGQANAAAQAAEQADNAAFAEAQERAKKAAPAQAEAEWKAFLEGHPTSRHKAEAAQALGQVQQELGKKDEAEQTLKASQQFAEERKKADLERPPKPPEGAVTQSLEEVQKALATLSPEATAQLVGKLERGSPGWALASLRLAKLQRHLGDRAHALQTVEEIAQQPGQGAPFDEARALRDQWKRWQTVDPKLVGVLLPRTGKFQRVADLLVDAIQLEIDLQDRGPVKAIVKDTKGEPDVAQQAVEELAEAGVIAIIGPIGTTESQAAAARAQELGIPLVSLSRVEGLTQLGDFVFREMTTSSQQARAVARYAAEKLQAKTFAVLQPDSPAGEDLTRYFWDAVDAVGGEMRGFERYPDNATNFKRTVQRLTGRDNLAERKEFIEEEQRIVQEITDPYRRRRALAELRKGAAPIIDFDVLFLADFASEVRLLAPAIASEDVITNGCDVKELEIQKKTTKKEDLRTVQLLGWMGWDSPDLVDERTGSPRYVQCSIFVDGFFAQSQRPATVKLVEQYNTAYSRVPVLYEAHAHDAAGIVKSIIEQRHPQTREEMRDALADMKKPFDGAAGDTTFDKDREAQKALFWLWINKGQIIEFDPTGTPPVPPVASAQPPPGAPPP